MPGRLCATPPTCFSADRICPRTRRERCPLSWTSPFTSLTGSSVIGSEVGIAPQGDLTAINPGAKSGFRPHPSTTSTFLCLKAMNEIKYCCKRFFRWVQSFQSGEFCMRRIPKIAAVPAGYGFTLVVTWLACYFQELQRQKVLPPFFRFSVCSQSFISIQAEEGNDL